ncbi:GNAT family N-acetyltransferase [Azospirillum sp. TSO22-1]|uniref:GNAT family N-acetyltransferase n=1 Tax=Azospirillum sp. TSO22-1 TaxID=716789 RepID=UPI000D6034A2|nr:GNAT family N-acetyltransferase [Azospirillum sp. TSO22-1]PWC53238.1 acetyltransferase [Azospirillum sp. TSO22-1]
MDVPAEFPSLSTDRLTLRAVTPDDAGIFHAILSVPEVTRFSNWPDAPTEEQAAAMVREMAGKFAAGSGCSWIIVERPTGDAIGAVRFNYVIPPWKCGGIGYELHPRAWGRGFMTEALRAVVGCGHRVFGLNRIEAWTLAGNGASDRVLEKVGFRYEGTARGRAWFKGAFHDFRNFGRVAADPTG